MFESVLNPHFEKIMIDVDLTITVEDDSMYPTYQRNDILFIKEQDTLGFEGQIMAVMIDSNTTLVRHVYSDPSGGYTLVSDNPAYPPEIKTPKEHPDLSLIGWVCGYTRLYDLERWYRHD
jgi:phage repressor protein C with HTH and peptisase S24 domain